MAAWPSAAALASGPSVAPKYTPCDQSKAWNTKGKVVLRRPPKMKAEIGTPLGFSQSGSIEGHCASETVKREFGCAALRPQPGVQSLPCQSMAWAGGGPSIPSHHTSPSSVSATLVKKIGRASCRERV